jgi:sugar phosphate isomerase/epimerase
MDKPQIGVSMLFCLSEPFEKMCGRLSKIETACIEIVDDGFHALNERRASKLKDIGESQGLEYSVHAPFADINIASLSKPILNAMIKRLKKSIVCARVLNAYVWVLHPGLKTGVSMFYPGMDWRQNLNSVRLLCQTAQDHGVEIAIENVPEPFPFLMKSVEHFTKFYDEIDEKIGLVLDIGHANIGGQIESYLTVFRKRIVHMHASDNDGKSDEHMGIGYATINWQKVAELLKTMSYTGVVVNESVDHVDEGTQRLRQLLT